MKPKEKFAKFIILILFVTNYTKCEYVADGDKGTLNDEFDEKSHIRSEYAKDLSRASEMRSSRGRIRLSKISRDNENRENSDLRKLKTLHRIFQERNDNINGQRNYSVRKIREVYLEMPRINSNKLASLTTARFERSLRNMKNYRSNFSKQQRKVRIRSYITGINDATSNTRQISEKSSLRRFYLTKQNYRNNLKEGESVSKTRSPKPVVEVRTFRRTIISSNKDGLNSREQRNRAEQNSRYRRFTRVENLRNQNDPQQININQFETIRTNYRDGTTRFTSNRLISKSMSSAVTEKQATTQEISETTDNRKISLNRQKRNTIKQEDQIQNTADILHNTESRQKRIISRINKRIAENRHRNSITRQRFNLNINFSQRTSEDRYRDGKSRERINVNMNTRQTSTVYLHQDDVRKKRVDRNTLSRKTVAEHRYKDDITNEQINFNTHSRQRITEGHRDSITRERINFNTHSRQRIAEDHRDSVTRERINFNTHSRQRIGEGHRDSISRERINFNTYSRQRIAEIYLRNRLIGEQMSSNIHSENRIEKGHQRDSITRERINVNFQVTQQTTVAQHKNDIIRDMENTRNRQSMKQKSIERQRKLSERSLSKSSERRMGNIQYQSRRMNIAREMDIRNSARNIQKNVENRESNSQRNILQQIRSHEVNRNMENIRNIQDMNRESNERQRNFPKRSLSKSIERRMENIQYQKRRMNVAREVDIRNSVRGIRKNVENRERNSQRNVLQRIRSHEVNRNMEKIRNIQDMNRESIERQRNSLESRSSKSSERRMEIIKSQNRGINILRETDIRNSARNAQRNMGQRERNSQRNTLEKGPIRSHKFDENRERIQNRQKMNRETKGRHHELSKISLSRSSESNQAISEERIRMKANKNNRVPKNRQLQERHFNEFSKDRIRMTSYWIERTSLGRQLEKRHFTDISKENINPMSNRNARTQESRRDRHFTEHAEENMRMMANRNSRSPTRRQTQERHVSDVAEEKIRLKINKNSRSQTRRQTKERHVSDVAEENIRMNANINSRSQSRKQTQERHVSDVAEEKMRIIANRNSRFPTRSQTQERHVSDVAEEKMRMEINRNSRSSRRRQIQERQVSDVAEENMRMKANRNSRSPTRRQTQERHASDVTDESITMKIDKTARISNSRQLQEKHFTEFSKERIRLMTNRNERAQKSKQLREKYFAENSEERIRMMTNKNARTPVRRQIQKRHFSELSEKRIRMMTNKNVRTRTSRWLQEIKNSDVSEELIRIITNRSLRTRTSRWFSEGRHLSEFTEERIKIMTNRNIRTRIFDGIFKRKVQDRENPSISDSRQRTTRSVIRTDNLRIISKVIGTQFNHKNTIANRRHFEFQLRMTIRNVRTRTTNKAFDRKIQNMKRSSVLDGRKENKRFVIANDDPKITSRIMGNLYLDKNVIVFQSRKNDKLKRQIRILKNDVRIFSKVNFDQERLVLQSRQVRFSEFNVLYMQMISNARYLVKNIRGTDAANDRNGRGFRGKTTEYRTKFTRILIATGHNSKQRQSIRRNVLNLENLNNLQIKSPVFGSQNSHLLRQRNGRGYRGRSVEQTADWRARIFSVNTRALYKATKINKFPKLPNNAQTSFLRIGENRHSKNINRKLFVDNTRQITGNMLTRVTTSRSRSKLPRRITVSPPKELNKPSSSRIHSPRLNLRLDRRLNNLCSKRDVRNNLYELNQRYNENRYFDNQFKNVQFFKDSNVRQISANSYDVAQNRRSLSLSRQRRQQISQNSLDKIRHSIPAEETRESNLRIEMIFKSNPEKSKIKTFSALEVVSMPRNNILQKRQSSRIDGTQEGRPSTYIADSREFWKTSTSNISSFIANLIIGFLLILTISKGDGIKTKPFKERVTDILFLRSSVF